MKNIGLKRVFIFAALACVLLGISAFTNQGGNTPQKIYCEIVGDGNFKGEKIKVSLVFGEDADATSAAQSDKDKVSKLSTMVDALNYMAKQGWVLEQTYAIPETAGMNRGCIFHYVLSMEI